MTRYVAARLVQLIAVLVGTSIITFLVMRVVPGDAAVAMLGDQATPARLAEVRALLGLDRPLPEQYFRYMIDALRGDLGRSVINNRPVAQELASRLPATLELTLSALLLGTVLGVPLGITAALRRGGLLDALTIGGSVVGVSMPIFWLGLTLIWVFAVVLGWFPVSGRLGADVQLTQVSNIYLIDALIAWDQEALRSVLHHLALPAVTLATIPMAAIARMTRSSMLEVLGEDYVRTAWAKGLSHGKVIYRHALRNASIPVLTLVGLQLGSLLGGAVVTEMIFSWPGIGRLVYDGVMNRDYPVVQGAVLVVTFLFVLINLAVDLLYTALDPRISFEGGGPTR